MPKVKDSHLQILISRVVVAFLLGLTAFGAYAPAQAREVPARVGVGEGARSLAAVDAALAVAAGGGHSCAVTSNHGVKCWGWNGFGQLGAGTTTNSPIPIDVIGLTNDISAITANSSNTCALTNSGGVKCWGLNTNGQLGDGTTTNQSTPVDVMGLSSGIAAIAAGSTHICALTSGGGVKCWGSNGSGQLGDGTTITRSTPIDVVGLSNGIAAIATGNDYTCAVTSDGGVKCWGSNRSGQLADGTTTNQSVPVDIAGLSSGITAIAAGSGYTCALTSGGGVKCWGGRVGNPTPTDIDTLTGGISAITLANDVGGDRACALTSNGGVKCWGANYLGQLGNGALQNSPNPVDVLGLSSGVKTVSAGGNHTCALTDTGEVKCWGDNFSGQLGDGNTNYRSIPMDVIGLSSGISAITAGAYDTCALTNGGGVKCWGTGVPRLAEPSAAFTFTFGSYVAVDLLGLSSGVTAVATGGQSCVLTSDGGVKCWGLHFYGSGMPNHQVFPADVPGLGSGISAITVGGDHVCVLTNGGGIKCWGSNSYGQLGDGTRTDRLTPVDVIGLSSGISAITAGYDNTCALTTSGGVKCWGANSYGQLGDGTTTDRLTPVDVIGLGSGISAITAGGSGISPFSAGGTHTCALTSSGGVKCWGSNNSRQLSNGTTTPATSPVDVVGMSNGISAIDAGSSHTCALTNGGGVKCWGSNNKGQLGTGTTALAFSPVEVIGMSSGMSAITAGRDDTCAITNGGGVQCWGLAEDGQLGINPGWTPVDVIGLTDPPVSEPQLSLNHTVGNVGSVLTLVGSHFPPNQQATITLNSLTYSDTISVDASGAFTFLLNTANADLGTYAVTAKVNPQASAQFVIAAGAPVWPQEGTGMILQVPKGIAFTQAIYLPLLLR